MEELIIKIENDIKVNQRCLQEKDIHPFIVGLLELWIKYDEELLEIKGEYSMLYHAQFER